MSKTVKVLAASAAILVGVAMSAQAACTLQVPFASGSAAVSASSAAYLQRLATSYPDMTVTVSGHADAVGDATANQALSERRIDAVLAELTNNGASPNVASRTALGETSLAVPSGAAQQGNRFVRLNVGVCDPAIFANLGAVPQVVPTTTPGGLAGIGGGVAGGLGTGLGVLGAIGAIAIIGNGDTTTSTVSP